MNFLAHLHLAKVTNTSVVGNLLGDFAKGRIENMPYDEEVLFGIKLHRFIDSFTDSHEWVQRIKSQSSNQRRYAGIVIDIFLDHLLAVQFDSIHPHEDLDNFCHQIYQELEDIPSYAPERYVHVVSNMRYYRWLESYQSIHNIEKAVTSVGQRFKKPVDLRSEIERLVSNKNEMKQDFLNFYNELQRACQRFAANK